MDTPCQHIEANVPEKLMSVLSQANGLGLLVLYISINIVTFVVTYSSLAHRL